MNYQEAKHLSWICTGFAVLSIIFGLICISFISAPIISKILFCFVMLLFYSHWLWMSSQIWKEYNKEELWKNF